VSRVAAEVQDDAGGGVADGADASGIQQDDGPAVLAVGREHVDLRVDDGGGYLARVPWLLD
jgi:hypothetical protein